MVKRFRVGDHVSWNSEAGRVSGRVVKVHTRDVNYHGYTHHASKDEPQVLDQERQVRSHRDA